MAIIITGSGERVAESYNGNAPAAPLFHVEYTTGGAAATSSVQQLAVSQTLLPKVPSTNPAQNDTGGIPMDLARSASDTEVSEQRQSVEAQVFNHEAMHFPVSDLLALHDDNWGGGGESGDHAQLTDQAMQDDLELRHEADWFRLLMG